ncbi:Fanconi anemia group C protein [Pseudophryne corroboree]|uniref:Fanconi anemia group C protein n=1 Tax=Pseudophryne corroboree TaxID=495146 RepID=UPI0030820033
MADKPVTELNLDTWLNKTIQWGDTTSLQSKQDVCLHFPKLQECLMQIYETVKHMGPYTAIEKFPTIGQLLGRLCWNSFVIGHEDTRKMLLCCLCCLYSNEPQNDVEKKANSWIKNLVCHLFSSCGQGRVENTEMIAQLGCTTADYYDKLLKNIISSLIMHLRSQPDAIATELSSEQIRSVCVICIPILTLPEIAPLLEALLLYHGPGSSEVLDEHFLESLNDAIQRKKIVLSESAVLSLWLRHLPSLEKAVLDLFQTLIALQSKSLNEMEQIIKDSFLPQAACHPAIFRVTDDIFRSALLQSEGNNKVMTIIRLFTHCFIQEYSKDNLQTKLPLRAYCLHKNTALVLALLRKVEGLTSDACIQHLHSIVKMLRSMDNIQRSHESVFESWFLLIHLGEWVDIAAELLLTSDPEISDDLLWLLAFYYNPCNENQSRSRTMVEAKAVKECLVLLRRNSAVCAMSLHKIFEEGNKEKSWHPCTLQLIRHLCVAFLLFSPEWHIVAKDCISHMTQTQEAASEVSDVLARTLCRLDIPGMERQKIITIAHKLLEDIIRIWENKVQNV